MDIKDWLLKNNIEEHNIVIENDIFNITLNKINFNIFKSTLTSSYIVSIPENTHFFTNNITSWLNYINVIIFEKKMNIKQIIKFILKNKIENFKIKKITNDIDFSEFKKTSHSLIESNIVNKLDNEIVMNILIEEFKNTSVKYNISLNNNNLFEWNLFLINFNDKMNNDLNKIKNNYGYDYIELNIKFHNTYPFNPPVIKVIRPRLLNHLMYKISNLKIISLDYWNSTRKIVTIIDKIYEIISNYGEIMVETELNNKEKYIDGAMYDIENIIISLMPYISIQSNINEGTYEKIIQKTNKNDNKKYINNEKNNEKKNVWKNGIGYSSNISSKWDNSMYEKLKEEKNNKIIDILNEILNNINEKNKYIIVDSCLIYFIIEKLNEFSSFSDDKLYLIIFTLLNLFTNENDNNIFTKTINKHTLYNLIEKIYNSINIVINANKTLLEEKICNLYAYISSNLKKNICIEEKKIDNDINICDEKILYVDKLAQHKLKFAQIENNCINSMIIHNITTPSNNSSRTKRISQELSLLKDSLPINYDASIFVSVDNTNMNIMKALIIGPKDTPYEHGCFIFDIILPNTFPDTPPIVYLNNTGGFRFNPNLYNDGKVCLSLLNTWGGHESERWSKFSTLLQVLLSIQAQILVDEPYYNEPGYQYNKNESKNIEYNNNVKYHTIKHATMTLKNDSVFNNIVNLHFYYKKNDIKKTIENWKNNFIPIKHITKNDFDECCNNFILCLEELKI